jgi:hypothetical protein
MENKLCLWRFHWDCGRMGSLESVFKATQAEIDEAIGKECYFGEVLGKHSEIYGTFEKDDIELITDDPAVVGKVPSIGYDPLEYIQYKCPSCDSSYCAEEMVADKTACIYCAKTDREELK